MKHTAIICNPNQTIQYNSNILARSGKIWQAIFSHHINPYHPTLCNVAHIGDGFHCPVTAMAFKMAIGRGKGKGRGGPSALAAFADDVPCKPRFGNPHYTC